MTTATIAQPWRPAGVPLGAWAHGIRIWIAVAVALAASFWLELEAPATAAICVAILAEPTRGRALEKAGFRVIATIIGVTVAIVITTLFSQARDLFLAAFAAWLGLCVYAAGLLDGNRAYAAVLSGYSVAIIAVQELDAPAHVFETGLARGAAIVVGIASIAVVNDLLAAPNHHPQLTARLAALRQRVRDHARDIVRDPASAGMTAATLVGDITALNADITSLVTESHRGAARTAAARSAAVALVAELHAIRMLRAILATGDPAWRDGIAATLDRRDGTIHDVPAALPAPAAWALGEVLRRDAEIGDGLAGLRAGTWPRRTWRAPRYRSHRAAAEAGIRAALWVGLASTFFVVAGWPSADVALAMVAIMLGLGAMTPDPRGYTIVALIGAPIAGAVAGIVEFGLLDGATEFPLLALALAPFVIGATVLTTRPHRLVAGIGRFSLIYAMVILAPSNPQSYDPNAYLFSVLFLCAATGLLLAAQLLIPPVTAASRQRWLLASARQERDHALSGRDGRWAPEEAMFRDATRIGQLVAVTPPGPQRDAVLREILSCFDQAGALRLYDAGLARRDALVAAGLAVEPPGEQAA